MTNQVTTTVDEAGVAVVTLNRPESRNAFTGEMGGLLSEAYARCDADDAVRAVVLTGSPPAFCVGADLSAGAETFVGTPDGFSASGVSMPAWRVRKPVIAAVNGHAVGIGLTLALQCDVRVMALDAKYGVVQVRRGVLGDAWAHWALPRLVGVARAAEILLLGDLFDGRQAQELGLTQRAVPADRVLPTALALATDLVQSAAPLSLAVSKHLLWSSFEHTVAQVGAAETAWHVELMAHADVREAMAAYLEQRPGRWTGQPSALDLDGSDSLDP